MSRFEQNWLGLKNVSKNVLKMIEIQVSNSTATLIPPRESLTPGMINAAQVHFTFSDEWTGLEKTAVFSNEIETVPAEVASDTATLPTEILDAVYRWISVGVTGENADGDVVIPTIWCRLGQVLPGASGKYVTQDQLKAYWSKQEIVFVLDGDGSRFLGDDGEYHHVAQGGGDVTKEELADALALKADKTEVEALVESLEGKADKDAIITVTSGEGSKYLADDGTYKAIQGGGDVTQQDLADATAPLATKSEVSAAVEPLATKTELANATAELATTTATNAALALKADKTELNSYAKQYDVNQALATKANATEVQNALAQKADKDAIITVTTGSGTLFLADDGTYKPAAGDPPDLSAYLTKTEAGTTYATKTETSALATKVEMTEGLAGKADASSLGDYETTAHASATYATKAEVPDVSDMLTKTEAGTTYATKTETSALATKVEMTEGLAGKADASSLGDYETTAHASATYATKAEVPDVADMLTKTEAGTIYATKTEVADGLDEKADASAIITVTTGSGTLFLADDGTYKPAAGDPPDLSAYLTKTEAGTTYETAAHASATYATKAEVPDVSGFETATHAEATYATKTELAAKADTSTMDSALALKADKAELGSYETTEHASTSYATKTELTQGLAGKVDTAEIADMLTKTEAASQYATISEVAEKAPISDTTLLMQSVSALENDVTSLQSSIGDKADSASVSLLSEAVTANAADITTLKTSKADKTDLGNYLTRADAEATYETQGNASPIKSITDGTIALTPDATGNVTVGRTAVSVTGVSTTPPNYTLIVDIAEIAPEGSADADGGRFKFTYTSNGTELVDAGVAIGDNDSSTLAFYELPTQHWVRNNFVAKADSSGGIKGIKWGETNAQVDDDGIAEIGSFSISWTASQSWTAPGVPGNIEYQYRFQQHVPGNQPMAESFLTYRKTGANTDFNRELNIFSVRIPTYDEFTETTSELASQEWVRAQLAALTIVYEGVEYLQSQPVPDNKQYIDTGIIPDSNTRILLDAQLLNTTQGYRMVGTQKDAAARFRIGTHTAGYWLVRFGGSEYTSAKNTAELAERHILELEGGVFKVDGEVRHTFPTSNFTATGRILLFAINDTALEDNAPMKLYSCKIWQGEELVRDFVPCYHKFAKIAGLYDKVEGNFYANIGSGAFTVGAPTGETW